MTEYTEEWADEFCADVAFGTTISDWCAKNPDGPSRRTIFYWLAQHEDFSRKYQLALEFKSDSYVEETVKIADGNGDPAKVRNQLSSRWWYAEKMRPKKYGAKTALELDGQVKTVVEIVNF